ncbi:MAG: radical SAM protein, partial [Myxococcota bacterium]
LASLVYNAAHQVQLDNFENKLQIRGILEFSNICEKNCKYCGIRRNNKFISRYHLSLEEILQIAREIEKAEITTIVLQSGESRYYPLSSLINIIKAIKENTSLALTLSTGVHTREEIEKLAEAGCDRFLLRFETSDQKIFSEMHPDDNLLARLNCLENLKRSGIIPGSGFMIGLPGSNLSTVARDLLFLTGLKLPMAGIGPYIQVNPKEVIASAAILNTEVYFLAVSLLRLLNPKMHIPATTAFDNLVPGSRMLLLNRGCNVFMPSFTRDELRKKYSIYQRRETTCNTKEKLENLYEKFHKKKPEINLP